MELKHIGLSEIKGPLVALENIKDVAFEEMVELELTDGSVRNGRVVQIEGDKAIIQVFEGNEGLSLDNTITTFLAHPMQLDVAREMLGRTFNGAGKPIDCLGPVFTNIRKDINGEALNPVAREYPKNYINTGISTIDSLITLIRGQKLPIFSGSGLSHNELALQIAKNAKIAGANEDNFAIVFAAMGVTYDVADYFRRSFEESGVLSRVVTFMNLVNEPIIERILTPRCALTTAEYLAYEQNMHVVVIMSDMTSYCEALREFSSSKEEIPGRKGYPGYLYSDLASLYERAGIIDGVEGSLTQIPILTMPNDDITHPIPDLTGYITEGQIVLSRDLASKGYFPPIEVLPSLSRLMKDGIGEGYTRKDHPALLNQLFASYAKVVDVRSLASVIGEDELGVDDKRFITFGNLFEAHFINQGEENRSIETTLDLGWRLLSVLAREQLDRLDDETIDKFYDHQGALDYFKIKVSPIIKELE